MRMSLPLDHVGAFLDDLEAARTRAISAHETTVWQPVHTVYVPAHRFRFDTPERLGGIASTYMDRHGGSPIRFARAVGLHGADGLPTDDAEIDTLEEKVRRSPEATRTAHPDAWLAHAVYTRVREKLSREPIEDLRIDFGDGYGHPSDDEEDADAVFAARELSRSIRLGLSPPQVGIRLKPLTPELADRAVRTADLFLTTFLDEHRGGLPDDFVLTLCRVQEPETLFSLTRLLDAAEHALGLQPKTLRLEIQLDQPSALYDASGRLALPLLHAACGGRCRSVHFDPHTFLSTSGIAVLGDPNLHPACDHARSLLRIAFASTDVLLSDGGTSHLPFAPEAEPPPQPDPSGNDAVHRAWRRSRTHIRHALHHGLHQGWDVHPGQLPVRFATVYEYFLSELGGVSRRMDGLLRHRGRQSHTHGHLDHTGTAAGLLQFLLRAISCGAITVEDLGPLGLRLEEIQLGALPPILAGRAVF